MRKISTLILVLFLGGNAFAQLSIKPSAPELDNFLYVNGSLLFVAQEVNLHKNWEGQQANIYLRSEAQLLQGGTGTTQNSGDGFISLFQEGTSNAYDYNYWASPVGTASTPSLFGIGMLYSPLTQTESVRAQTTDALDGSSQPLMISSRWIHTYAGNSYSSWKYIGNRTEIPPGFGFSMKGVNGTDFTMIDGRPNNPGSSQRYDFRGMPHNGTVLVPIAAGEHVLTGNPYPSALDLSLFLLENSGTGTLGSGCYGNIARNDITTGIAYFWDSKEEGSSHYLADYVGGYGAFSPVDPCTSGIYERPIFSSYGKNASEQIPEMTGNHYERRYLPVGQGFMLEGRSNSNFTFTNAQRIFKKEGNYSDFKIRKSLDKDIQVIPKVRLQIEINKSYIRHLTLGFWPTATSGVDHGMDAKALDQNATDVGWYHDNSNFIIDVRPFLEKEEIPLFLTVEDSLATFKFKLVEYENIEVENMFLLDRAANKSYSLGSEFIEFLLAPGEHHQRLALVFGEGDEDPNDEEEESINEDDDPLSDNNGSADENEDSVGDDGESSNEGEEEESPNEDEDPDRDEEESPNEGEGPAMDDDNINEDTVGQNEHPNDQDEESSNENEDPNNEGKPSPVINNDVPDSTTDDPMYPELKELIIFHNNELKQIEVINPYQKCFTRLILYNLNGKQVKIWNSPGDHKNLILPSQDLPESIYFLKLVQENSTEITKKILILE